MRDSEGLFVISVAARLLDMHPQTLRKYERVGFVIPSRTTGKIRLYSQEDIARLEQVKYLVNERDLNLAGVDMALDVTERIQAIAGAIDPTTTISPTPWTECWRGSVLSRPLMRTTKGS
jgi:MerR family transcriptional regulator/heat shock protein HspR